MSSIESNVQLLAQIDWHRSIQHDHAINEIFHLIELLKTQTLALLFLPPDDLSIYITYNNHHQSERIISVSLTSLTSAL